jgi:hypothetical protein
VKDDAEFELRLFRDGTDFTFYRGREQDGQRQVLGVAQSHRIQKHDRLLNEYALASQLDPAWAARPVKLINYRGQEVLILEDPGGEPLDLVIEQHREAGCRRPSAKSTAMGLSTKTSSPLTSWLMEKAARGSQASVYLLKFPVNGIPPVLLKRSLARSHTWRPNKQVESTE